VGGVLVSLLIVIGGGYWYLEVRPASVDGANPGPAAARDVDPRSVAVTPFTVQDDSLAYLGDGIAEEILTALSAAEGLQVAARSSSFKLRGQDARTVGEELAVALVLEGSVQVSGDRVKVKVDLVVVDEDRSLWSESVDGQLVEVFEFQEYVARRVVEGLSLEFSGGGAGTSGLTTRNPAAFTAYLRGRSAANARTPDGLREGIRQYEQALTLDAEFAEAYSALAIAHSLLPIVLAEAPEVAYRDAREMAEAALALNPGEAEAHAALGSVRSAFDWDWVGAEEEFLRALTLRPSYTQARQWYAQLLAGLGRFAEAAGQAQDAARQDPLSPGAQTALGVTYYMARDYDLAIEQFELARDRFPDAPATSELLGWAYREAGRADEAVAAHEVAVAGGQGLLAESSRALALAAAGRRDEALRATRRLETEDRNLPALAVRIAMIHARLGNTDTGFEWLEIAARRREPWLTYLNVEPAFDQLRGDSRFEAMVRRLGLDSDHGTPQ